MNTVHANDARPRRPHTMQAAIGVAFVALAVVLLVRTIERAPDAVAQVAPSAAIAGSTMPTRDGQRFVPSAEGTFGEIEPLPPQF